MARGFDAAAISDTLDKLAADRLLDDRRFTELYITQRAARGFGPARIRAELKERGVEGSLIDECLKTPGVDWESELTRTWQKKYGRCPQNFQEQTKQARFLEYRGYSSSSICRFFDRRLSAE